MGRPLIVWCFCGFSSLLVAQSDSLCWIGAISVQGAKHTKEAIILREMLVHPGDTLPVELLARRVEQSRLQLLNTGLFTAVEITYKNWEAATARVHLLVAVDEAWYIFPVPVFDLADRNFNIWWVEQKRSLDRVNYGLDFSHLNFTGNNDPLKAKIQFGYTRKYSLRYSLPFINRAKTVGLSILTDYSQNREVNYATTGNKQDFWRKDDRFVYTRFRTELGMTYRPGARNFHYAELAYNQNRVDPFVADSLNPGFFLEGRSLQRYFSLLYEFTADYRDVRAYPLNGYFLRAKIRKDGLGFFPDRDALTLTTRMDYYHTFGKRWSAAVISNGKFSFIRAPQPYNDNRALGFGDLYLPGYEYYLADGLDMALLRSIVRYRALDMDIRLGKWMPLANYRRIPFKAYLACNAGWAVVNDPFPTRQGNPLSNRPLWGGGPALHLVFFYDKVLLIEYSFNHLGEKGLFLHLNMGI